MMEPDAVRCPSCGAMSSWGADWCGQCLRPLGASLFTAPEGVEEDQGPQFYMAEPAPACEGAVATAPPPMPGAAAASSTQSLRRPTWPCAVCETENPMELDTCAACGAPFGRLFQQPESGPHVDPRSAVVRSLLFPGLGQIHCGRTADGVARAVLYLWTAGTSAVMLMAHGGSGSAIMPVGVLFLLMSFVIYGTAALDSYRQAAGEQPILSPRYLLYGTVGLIMLSLVSLFVLVTRAAHIPR